MQSPAPNRFKPHNSCTGMLPITLIQNAIDDKSLNQLILETLIASAYEQDPIASHMLEAIRKGDFCAHRFLPLAT